MQPKSLPITRWRLSEVDSAIQEKLSSEFGLSPIVSQILTSRDILEIDDARRFLSPSLTDLHNPYLMKDMRKGVNRLVKGIRNRESIVIYGDYDADGITSVVILLKFLRRIDPSVSYHIPDRIGEGYSLNRTAIDRFKAQGISLIVTVDCGISDADEVAYAKGLGIDTIILDHHEVPPSLPNAAAVINPHRTDCPFPFKDMAAVGIAFNFLIALRGVLREEGFWNSSTYPNLRQYLDLVALGTIGDISPLIDENRILAKIGLDLITEGRSAGIRALKEVCGIDSQLIDSTKASYNLIPRINAAGRIASPRDAVNLLMTEDMETALTLARQLDVYNRRRQDIEREILGEILKEIEDTMDPKNSRSLVFASSRWHPGVIGIVASRLVDRYYRPAILISLKDGIGKGSGRSIADFDIYRGLQRCDSLLLSYGGHRFAAGISIREEHIPDFRTLLESVIQEETQASDMVSQTVIDAECRLQDITHNLLSQIETLAPYGARNPEPILCVRNVNVLSPSVVGNNHLRMRISSSGTNCNSIWFSKGHYLETITGLPVDIAFTPQINTWGGISDIQLKMHDVAITSSN
ncbi:MAG TPA: single-stranded-DNA-specific exonuclease RecJ [Syntrophales bacterium]|nr:single-stranded-DNA-specific exonuclease RecJ [Syntrophales bacterium]